jgi:hypothetical protein
MKPVSAVLGALLLAMLLAGAAHSLSIDTVEIRSPRSDLTHADLQILASAAGVHSESFDYEAEKPHCLHFWLELTENGAAPDLIDAGSECDLAGPHRITVQWREKNDRVTSHFFLQHLGQGNFTGIEGPTIEKFPGPGGIGIGRNVPLELAYDQRSELTRWTHTASGAETAASEDWNLRKQAVVYVELRDNPETIIGTK